MAGDTTWPGEQLLLLSCARLAAATQIPRPTLRFKYVSVSPGSGVCPLPTMGIYSPWPGRGKGLEQPESISGEEAHVQPGIPVLELVIFMPPANHAPVQVLSSQGRKKNITLHISAAKGGSRPCPVPGKDVSRQTAYSKWTLWCTDSWGTIGLIKVGVYYEDRQGSHGVPETEATGASVLT